MKTREELQKQLEEIGHKLSIKHGFNLDKHMTPTQMANLPYTIAKEAYIECFNTLLPLLLDACETIEFCVDKYFDIPYEQRFKRDLKESVTSAKAREFLQSLDTFLKGKT